MVRRQKYDAFGFNSSELKQMQGAFGGSSKGGSGLPPLQLNLIDLRPARVKYLEKKRNVDKRLENMRYERKLETIRKAEDALEREHPISFIGYAKKGFRRILKR